MNNKSLIPMPDLNLNDIVHLSKENEKLIVNFLSTSDELHTINFIMSISLIFVKYFITLSWVLTIT